MDIKHAFVKIYNFIQREFTYAGQTDTQGKFINFGPLNNFPNQLDDLVQGSPTATACLSTLADFISGEGFSEGKELETLVINKQGLKFWVYHNIMSDSFAHKWGVASIVKYNGAGQITEIFDIPFNYCRLGEPDSKGVISTILYNPYFGTGFYKSKDTLEYDVYNPDAAAIQLQKDPKKYKGQINWAGIRDRKNPFYPIPDYYSAHHWMRVEKNAGVYFDENLENGFLQSLILKMKGDPNDPSGIKDSNDKDIPKGKAFDDMMSHDFSGSGRTAKIMAWWANNPEEFPEIMPFPTNNNADIYRVQDDHAIKKITVATKVPSILANISEGVSLGGDGNTIRAAVKLMQQRAVRPQDFLIDYYQDMLKRMVNPYTKQIKVVEYDPFPEIESIDPQVWGVLTREEQRKWAKDHTEIELLEDTAPVQTPPAQNNTPINLHFNSYPKKAQDTIKRALEWNEKMNGCLKKGGMDFSNEILNGSPLGPKEIKRLSRYLSKNYIHKDKPYTESCEALGFDAWGGSEMMIWANDKVKELNGQTD